MLSKFRLIRPRLSRALSSYSRGDEFTPRDDLNLNSVLLEACETHADKVQYWIQMEGREITYGEMNELAEQLASGLLAAGHKPGDRIGVWGPNQSPWVITKWACYKAGFQLVTLNPMYTARELEYACNKVNIAAIVCPKEIGPLDYHAKIEEMCPMLQTQTRGALNFENVPSLRSVTYYNSDEVFGGVYNFDELMNAGGSNELNIIKGLKVDPQLPANIQFTSGTTGAPKAAALSHYNMINNALAVQQATTEAFLNDPTQDHSLPLPLDDNTKWCCLVPLYHVFGFVGVSVISALAKCEVAFPHPGFSSDMALNAIEARGATIMSGTPTMMIDIINNPERTDYDVSSLRYLSVGGAPVTTSLIKDCDEKLDARISVGYGMTENSCATITTNGLTDTDEIAGAIGRPLPGTEAKIVDPETMADLPADEVGELCTRGYMQFLGYVDDEAKTQESMLPGGWWRTGDMGFFDSKYGVYNLSGRSKDMIIRGGENIQPTEIEDFYSGHPGIDDIYVVGVPSKRLGEEVCAYVKLSDKSLTVDALKQHGVTGLAKFKVPKYIAFVDEFPMTVTGKVKKFELREQALVDFPHLKAEIE